LEKYCAARFDRGTGLGNRLYPWARCHLHARAAGIPMLAPHWWWPPRVRPLLEQWPPVGELPGHLYLRGLRALPEYISGARRLLIETTSRADIRVFRGEAGRFTELDGKADDLLAALRKMSTLSLPIERAYVALHVRRGDFSATARTPTEWFISALRALRAEAGRDVPALVVSDSDAADLADLLREPAMKLARTGSPLADLLILAGARVLLASGSSFSAWAAFLGGMPAVTQPQHSLAWFGVRARSYLGHFQPGANNSSFLRAAVAAF
jgi:hypothetical protein